MNANILIGIGGTGAKVVEATLHCAVAGLISTDLKVGMVDQDGTNGNVARTLALLENVTTTRRLWREIGRNHVVGSGPLFATDISALSVPASWTPHPEPNTTLAGIFDREAMEAPEKALFDGLFAVGTSQANTEQGLELGRGYSGRPHIGAAAMASSLAEGGEDIEFWRNLNTALAAARGATEVRVMLAGSVFGGAGAAGFPTLARLIRRRLKDVATVRIGGVLMLPYFGFAPPERTPGEPPGDEANVAVSQDLLIQSQSALKHYYQQLREEQVFDQLYLVGWQRPFELGYHRAGENQQTNPALLPELVGAMAACRFYKSEMDDASKGEVLVSARHEDHAFGWSDLPSPTADADAPRHALGRLLRFATAWKYWGPMVTRPRGMTPGFALHAWYKRQKLHTISFDRTPAEDEVRALNTYVNALLTWAGAIEAFARRDELNFQLWDMRAFVGMPAQPWEPVTIREPASEDLYQRYYNGVILSDAANTAPPSAAILIQRLTAEEEPARGQQGLGVFVSALHAFSDIQPARV